MKAYKITIEDTDEPEKIKVWYGSLGHVLDMLSCESCITKTRDAKNLKNFTIRDEVLKGLKVDIGPSISKTKENAV